MISAILGAQWGDEGKGKIVDRLSLTADVVARFQGGPNAGHTIKTDTTHIVLHHIPSGILHPHITALIGSSVVVEPLTLLKELETLKTAGYNIGPDRLKISYDANIIFPIHIALDKARESYSKTGFIGTTLRGIGPVYEDHTARRGIRFRDLLDMEIVKDKLKRLLFERNAILEIYGQSGLVLSEELEKVYLWRDQLLDYCALTNDFLNESIKDNKRILIEGAQGTMLDLNIGSYPYVTSSTTTINGINSSLGISQKDIDCAWGVVKAYTTKVGQGPFPTEIHNEASQHIASVGKEFGATTGRPRRIGWLDLVALKYAIKANNLDLLALTKLDVLSGLDQIGYCTEYLTPFGTVDYFLKESACLEDTSPVFTFMDGWSKDITKCSKLCQLPYNARAFLDRIANEVDLPIDIVSVGANRNETIIVS